MYITKLSSIDWYLSMSKLSIGAFYLLNVLDRFDIEISDASLRDITKLGVSTHRKHKKELIDSGYLIVDQTGKAEYHYQIKDPTHGK